MRTAESAIWNEFGQLMGKGEGYGTVCENSLLFISCQCKMRIIENLQHISVPSNVSNNMIARQISDLGSKRPMMKKLKKGGETEELRRKMAALQVELDSSKPAGSGNGAMENDLVSTKHELLRIREMLEMAEKELEKKVSLTAPFKNLKQMLMKKNETMKDLRKRLQKFENGGEKNTT
ncbi:LZTL1-like protein [Mya arenaria]|uniref:Leucine zipper transcription factor-like protein 1 n=1 Tax=Mya arenaria TaxID=6604 RepID=A0ABY7E7S8_MYAAR|nr:LZTL1-like protein [Mya arenaria]